jgi:hypothetical protein
VRTAFIFIRFISIISLTANGGSNTGYATIVPIISPPTPPENGDPGYGVPGYGAPSEPERSSVLPTFIIILLFSISIVILIKRLGETSGEIRRE